MVVVSHAPRVRRDPDCSNLEWARATGRQVPSSVLFPRQSHGWVGWSNPLCDVLGRPSPQLASRVGSLEMPPISPIGLGVEDDLVAAVPAFSDELSAIALGAKSPTSRLRIRPRHAEKSDFSPRAQSRTVRR